MKKVLLFAFTAIAISTVTYGQIEKGTVLLGGNLNFGTSKSENSTLSSHYKNETSSYGFTPSVGFTIKPNTIVGLQLGYAHSKNTSEPNSGTQEHNDYSAEIFLRRYLTLGKGFYVFAQPGVFFNRNIYEYITNSSNQENKGWNVGVSLYPGISYAVSKRFHLEAGLGNFANLSYSKSQSESKDISSNQMATSKSSGFSFSSSLSDNSSISIGFRFFIPKKAKSS